MDKKFRISFYPKDASNVKVFAFSRRFFVIAFSIILPLAAIGAVLVLAGYLHDAPNVTAIRKKLNLENGALKERVGELNHDLRRLRGDLSHLEEQKVNALILSGVEYSEAKKKQNTSKLFSFFQSHNTSKIDVAEELKKANRISNYFDSTLSVLQTHAALIETLPTGYPVAAEAIVTREFGYSPDPFTGRKALHAGLDFSLKAGAPIYATGGGTVLVAEKDLLWGNCIRINHGKDVESFYAHLQDVKVHKGQRVARGDVIGSMGMSGVATGVHLHYELTVHQTKTDPMNFFLPNVVTMAVN